MARGPSRHLVSAGVRWDRLLSSICLTSKSATSAREMNPEVQSPDQPARYMRPCAVRWLGWSDEQLSSRAGSCG